MRKEISKQSRQELISAIRHRYFTVSKKKKTIILNEFVAMTGYHRKHAIRVLGSNDQCTLAEGRCGNRIYDEAVKEALVVLWEASDRICGKRLKAIVPTLIEAMECNHHLNLDPEVRNRLLQISSSTIDRLLASYRVQAKGRRKKKNAPKKASKQIPIRTFSDWEESLPGELEIDFVVHCGGTMSGAYISSLVGTDVCSGWTEAVPLIARGQTMAVEGIDVIYNRFPVPVIGLNSDNDSAFINETLLAYCQRQNLNFTRARPYRKNDQAWIEQKNGAIIRHFVGYERFSGIVAGQLLGKLYKSLRLYVNYFQPSFKLLSKTREGAKIKKRYSKPMTPADRLLLHPIVSEDDKEALRIERSQLDPIKLLHRIRDIQSALSTMRSPGDGNHPGKGLDEFLSQLPNLWKAGEVRPTHRKPRETPRPWRTHPDAFEGVWAQVLYWLGENPDATAKSLFERLMVKYPGKFQIRQLRTLQRRVKEWRYVMARELVFACNNTVDDPDNRR